MFAFGFHDCERGARVKTVLVSDAPDGSDAVAETKRVWFSDDFEAIIQKVAGLTGSYAPPGS